MIGVNATVDGNKNFMGVVSEIGVYCTPRTRARNEKEERNNIFGNRDLKKFFSQKFDSRRERTSKNSYLNTFLDNRTR